MACGGADEVRRRNVLRMGLLLATGAALTDAAVAMAFHVLRVREAAGGALGRAMLLEAALHTVSADAVFYLSKRLVPTTGLVPATVGAVLSAPLRAAGLGAALGVAQSPRHWLGALLPPPQSEPWRLRQWRDCAGMASVQSTLAHVTAQLCVKAGMRPTGGDALGGPFSPVLAASVAASIGVRRRGAGGTPPARLPTAARRR